MIKEINLTTKNMIRNIIKFYFKTGKREKPYKNISFIAIGFKFKRFDIGFKIFFSVQNRRSDWELL